MDEFPFNNETRYERVIRCAHSPSRANRELTTLEIHFREDARIRDLFLFRDEE